MNEKITINGHIFQHELLTWFKENKRTLPWRLTKNPYYIWISEVMLQQTQVDSVIPYYERFIRKFPTPQILADASQEEVYKAWEGLGYYSRARNLQQGVREVVEKYSGSVPQTKSDILDIKGIGPYTAGAILSIAYGLPEPAVDGNVMRVLSRIMLVSDDIMQAKTRKRFETVLYSLIPNGEASYFNQGLMELGALICKPKNPLCDQCPVATHCQAFEEGVQERLPVKKKKKAPKRMNMSMIVLSDKQDHFFIHKRPNQGLLASLWEFPTIESLSNQPVKECEAYMKSEYDITCELKETGLSFTHTFSHIKWVIHVFEGTMGSCPGLVDNEKRGMVNRQDLRKYPFPIPHQKIIKKLEKDCNDKIQK